jgi:acyl-CoA synthetase (AMP-forming)/AMP-acid ligase II
MAGSHSLNAQLGLADGDVVPIPWPFAHIGGVCMLTAVLRAGGTLVLFDTWDPATTPRRTARHRPTVLGSATPFFLAYLQAQAEAGPVPLYPALRACTGGGAPVPEAVSRDVAAALGVRGVTGSYGLTEFPVATGQTPADDDVGRSVGRPAPGVTVRVVDGELRCSGPQAFLGYVDPALDAEGFDAEGWVRTGDLGWIDDEGRVHVTGRAKDVIIRSAENISANEIEEVLLRHPRVVDAAVIGLPDARTGERVCAVLVVDGAPLGVDDVAAHCTAAGLARFKCPERVELTDQLPRNAMGKILKAELRVAYDPIHQAESAGRSG